jgi:predicted HTH transcriptional regulator
VNLDPVEIAARIAQGEGKTLEFKRGLPRDDKIARTLAAFANTRGGLLLIGVGDTGELLGAPRPRQTLERVREIAANGLEPALKVELGLVELAGKRIVCCSVPLSPARPHAVLHVDGEREVVTRSGSSNRAADGATLKAILEQRTSKRSLDALERRVLAWVDLRTRGGAEATSQATVAGFCNAANIGKQRAKRAFVELERAGLLVGHGAGARRAYSRPT